MAYLSGRFPDYGLGFSIKTVFTVLSGINLFSILFLQKKLNIYNEILIKVFFSLLFYHHNNSTGCPKTKERQL